jgi:endonuclease/exonuclease/phosphatase family metal-dependent hydrolase
MSPARGLCCIALMAAAIASADDTRIRVVTYNIHHGEGRDGRIDLERIADVLLQLQPDVVCLQEVDQNVDRSGKLDMPARLAALLGMQAAFGHNYAFGGGLYGNATFSRLPIVEHENIALPTPAGVEPRGCLRTRIQVGNGHLDVFNTHLGLKPDQREKQVAVLTDLVGGERVVLAGDLNEKPAHPLIKGLTALLQDVHAFREEGSGTLPGGDANRIDFVLASMDIDVLSSRIVVTPQTRVASDHYPVAADLSLGEPSRGAGAAGRDGAKDERTEEEAVGAIATWPGRNSE